ncbi:MAG: hypothetical protein K5Q00_00575 [Gammaproteobacteria bacterium]|nr:hypothetical protein [Gammaproteobacteria bacterium]
MDTLQNILGQTPWWVYTVLIVAIYRGILALKNREVYLWRMAILPVVFFGIGLHTALQFFAISASYIVAYLTGLGIGTYIGYRLAQRIKMLPSPKPNYVYVQGSKQMLFSVIAIFIVKYAEGFALATYPVSAGLKPITVILFDLGIIVTGVFVGYFIRYYQVLKSPR